MSSMFLFQALASSGGVAHGHKNSPVIVPRRCLHGGEIQRGVAQSSPTLNIFGQRHNSVSRVLCEQCQNEVGAKRTKEGKNEYWEQ